MGLSRYHKTGCPPQTRGPRPQRGAWETFKVTHLAGGHLTLRAKGQYLQAVGAAVHANSPYPAGGAVFKVIQLESSPVALRSVYHGDRHVRIFKAGDTPTVSSRRIDRYAMFNVVELSGGKVALRTSDGVHYLRADLGGGSAMNAKGTSAVYYNTFTLTEVF